MLFFMPFSLMAVPGIKSGRIPAANWKHGSTIARIARASASGFSANSLPASAVLLPPRLSRTLLFVLPCPSGKSSAPQRHRLRFPRGSPDSQMGFFPARSGAGSETRPTSQPRRQQYRWQHFFVSFFTAGWTLSPKLLISPCFLSNGFSP